MGDFNCQLSRNNRFVQIVKNFMEGLNLVTLWDKFPCDFTYIHHVPTNEGRYPTSTIDHIMVQENFVDKCLEACVLHLGENLSSHEIIFLKIQVDFEPLIQQNFITKNSHAPKWDKATDDQIHSLRVTLCENLNNLIVPVNALHCRDIHCTNDNHKTDIDSFHCWML